MRNVGIGQTPRAYFNVPLSDLSGPALNEAGSQPQVSLNGANFDDSGIGTLVAVGFGEYYALIDSSIIVQVGDRIFTRYKGASTAEVTGDDFLVGGESLPDDVSVSCYGSVANADLFFSFQLNATAWTSASSINKRKALVSATQLIDVLNYAGRKSLSGQVLQFPRKNCYLDPLTLDTTTTADDNVPTDIKIATYIVALKLLDGYDRDTEADILSVASTKFGQVSTGYVREYVPEHMRAGIPSARAWDHIRPYLRDPAAVVLDRI